MSDAQRVRPVGIFEQNRLRLLIRLVLNGGLQALAAIAVSKLMHRAFDQATHPGKGGDDGDIFVLSCAAIAVISLVLAWLRVVERVDSERMGQDYVKQLRMQLFNRISESSVRQFQHKSKGAIMLRFIGDLRVVRSWISLGLSRLIVASATLAIALTGLAELSPAVALGPVSVIALGLLVGIFWGKHLMRAMSEARMHQSAFAANVNEKITSIAVVQAFGQLHRERERIADQGEKLKEAMVVQARVAAQLRGVADAVASLAAASVLLIGALQVQAGKVTAGAVVAAMAVVHLITPVLRDLSSAFIYWHGARISLGKIQSFLDESRVIAEMPNAPPLLPGPGAVELRNVTLDTTLRGVSGFAPPGSRVALIGPNGSGKSTLLSLMARLAEPDGGEILLDGQDLAQHSLASLRRRLGVVSPDLPLLRGSIESNLRYRRPDATEEELVRIISLCGLDELLREFPEGLQAPVTEGGASLSLGQRQRVSLGRALLGNPSVLLLDEADANLDPRSGQVLARAMASFRGTVLMISHNYDFVRSADLVWYMEDGRIVEAGPPGSLLGSVGPASRFFSQMGALPPSSETRFRGRAECGSSEAFP